MEKITCAGMIFFMVGVAVGDVGEMPKEIGPYTWQLPITLGLILTGIAVMGYLAGRKDACN